MTAFLAGAAVNILPIQEQVATEAAERDTVRS